MKGFSSDILFFGTSNDLLDLNMKPKLNFDELLAKKKL